MDYRKYIEENTKDINISYRGGTLKVDLSGLFTEKSLNKISEAGERAEAGAYQNYLGGGIAGSIQTGRMFDTDLLTKGDYKKYLAFAEAVKRYFYDYNNGGGDDYMQNESGQCFESLQKRAVIGY